MKYAIAHRGKTGKSKKIHVLSNFDNLKEAQKRANSMILDDYLYVIIFRYDGKLPEEDDLLDDYIKFHLVRMQTQVHEIDDE